MIARPASARSSRGLSRPTPTSSGHAGSSRHSDLKRGRNKRSAHALAADEEDGELDIGEQGLSLGEVGDGEGDSDEDLSGDDEAFPELDSGSETGEDGEDGEDGERIHHNEESNSEDESYDDEDSGSASGYNSSDIERRYESSPTTSAPTSLSASSNDLTTDEKLSRMIRRSTMKPDEAVGTDATISAAKEGHGRLRKSRLVEGGFKREYADVEAGYGSESSTEDVSQAHRPHST